MVNVVVNGVASGAPSRFVTERRMFSTLSPLNNVLDVLIGVFMIWRLGWHPAFLPAFVAELIPFVDVLPTWTLAVWWVTRGQPAEPLPPAR